MKQIEVVAAIIQKEGKILCAQRGPGGPAAFKWEFPGGKMEKGETEKEALIREIHEELDAIIVIEDDFLTVRHTYEGSDGFELIMHSFLCQLYGDKLMLKEHIKAKWLHYTELSALEWADADWPIVKKIVEQK